MKKIHDIDWGYWWQILKSVVVGAVTAFLVLLFVLVVLAVIKSLWTWSLDVLIPAKTWTF